MLMILTSEEQVSIHYNTDQRQPLGHISAAQARTYIDDGEFDEKGMLPKMEASVNFVSQKAGRQAVITSIEHAVEALHGEAGTIIS